MKDFVHLEERGYVLYINAASLDPTQRLTYTVPVKSAV